MIGGTGWLERAAGFFVAPPAQSAPPRATTIPSAARAVVLGASAEVVAAAAAVALALRERDAAPAALVAIWRGKPPAAGIATRAAARLAERVATDESAAAHVSGRIAARESATAPVAAGVAAGESATRARGRLAWLSLPSDPVAAAGAVRGASALVAGPFVTALAGARPPELETLIAEHDIAVVVADPDTALARAALAARSACGVPAVATPPLQRGPARSLALAGIAAPRLAALEPTRSTC